MDWLNQDKLRNWLIIVLLGLNLLTVSIIWMHTAKGNGSPLKDPAPRGSESVNLMKKVLDLNEAQTSQIESIQSAWREQSKSCNDLLSSLKRQLAEELFKDNPDTVLARTTAAQIGELQSKVELIRFQHFRDELAVCTSEQKEKLKPIIFEVFGRKPPREEPGGTGQRQFGQKEEKPLGTNRSEPPNERPRRPREDKPGPPSIEEKVARYVERLKLSDEQAQKLRIVIQSTSQKGDELRARVNPDPREIEAAKERIRQEEDKRIMAILREDQKAEFSRMILGRQK